MISDMSIGDRLVSKLDLTLEPEMEEHSPAGDDHRDAPTTPLVRG